MKSDTKIILALVVVTVLAVGIYSYSKKEQERKANPAGDLSNPNSDASLRKKIQDWINGVMTGTNGAGNQYGANGAGQSADLLGRLLRLKRGAPHEEKDTMDNAKQQVFRWATAGSTYRGTWDQYSYPNIERFSTPNGQVQTNSSNGGILNVLDGILNVVPGGGVVKGIIDIFD